MFFKRVSELRVSEIIISKSHLFKKSPFHISDDRWHLFVTHLFIDLFIHSFISTILYIDISLYSYFI